MVETTRGLVFVHSAPSALCPHVEWAVGGVLRMPTHFSWTPQPAERGSYRTEYSWTGAPGTAAAIASALKGWERLRFEVTEEASRAVEAHRYSYTPSLGAFHAITGVHGDILVAEDRIKAAVAREALGGKGIHAALDELLGRPWDDELEIFRHAAEGAPVRWLHQVV
ncbi:MAG TPA: DUF3145 domain-containing protein [Propionibacteriaceae bacterium]|nr:DUF3145 domain-containing protein [Propionibacteriaceae bacterium]